MPNGIIAAIGNTPLVKLVRIFEDCDFQLYAKLENLNPAGSMKDRAASAIIENAMKLGVIHPGCVVVESSSGNMGIGLAQICRYYGLRFICVVDAKTVLQNIKLLKSYGAEIELVSEPHPITGEFLQARLDRVHALLKSVKGAFWPNQYANLANPLAHQQTMSEIVRALNGNVDYMFCATSTCGTLRGCVEYAQNHSMHTKFIAVDAVGSVIFGGPRGKRLIPGHGAAVRPALYQDGLADECIHVSDVDCIIGCRRLLSREAILAGGSSGGAIMAIDRYRNFIPGNSNCVVILADRGERYLDTIYSDEWVSQHFGTADVLIGTRGGDHRKHLCSVAVGEGNCNVR
jgi:N-(2-amino-2-carboxyethyl)-L-glutamate synthase